MLDVKKPLASFENLRVEFDTKDGKVVAVEDVSFEIKPKQTVCLVGESGSGKSVSSLSMMRLVEFGGGKLSGGKIFFTNSEGRKINLSNFNQKQMRNIRGNEIGMIFQEPMTALNPVFTIERQLTEGLIVHKKISKRKAKMEALELLRLVRIPEPEMRMQQYPHELSGGMRQRVVIAMALACEPRLLIADEPTTALDVTIEAQILELLEAIKSEFNMSMIYISHDLAVIGEISDRILVMYFGRVVESGLADEVIDNPLHPYTRALLKSIPKIDQPIESLEPIEGTIPSPFEVHTGCPFYSRCSERLGEICLNQKPANKTYNNGHTVSCHLHA